MRIPVDTRIQILPPVASLQASLLSKEEFVPIVGYQARLEQLERRVCVKHNLWMSQINTDAQQGQRQH
jgi:hypothetical protein